jgi:DNA-binding LacI/PurR family transcriptional regulator
MSRVRLQDVAEHAGVSMKTVSNVVHKYQHVSPAMRTRVEAAIDALGYRPNISARRLATGRTGTISLAFNDVSLPYFGELARMITSEAARRGYRILLEQTDGTAENDRAIVSTRDAGLVDGVIFQPARLASLESGSTADVAPLVLLGEGQAPLAIDHVSIDNHEAASAATAHLLALGRTRIGFLGHEAVNPSATSIQRLTGYTSTLRSAGLPLDPSIVLATTALGAHEAAAVVRRALAHGTVAGEPPFDALVCRDDLAAIGALRALGESGVRVPDDVAVIGWDDITMASFTNPSLSTIAPDMAAIATTALDLLEQRIAGHTGPGRHVLAGYRLVARESAPIAG